MPMFSSSRDFWPTLLDKMEEGRVVPVIGPSLISASLDGCFESLEHHLARRLATRQRLEGASDLPAGTSLFEVVARLHQQDKEGDYHSTVNRLLKEFGNLTVPPALASLARITDFKLYLSLSFDSLLLRALDEERGLSYAEARHLAYAPNQKRNDRTIIRKPKASCCSLRHFGCEKYQPPISVLFSVVPVGLPSFRAD